MKVGDLVEVTYSHLDELKSMMALVVGFVGEDNPRIPTGYHRFAKVKWLSSGRVEPFDAAHLRVIGNFNEERLNKTEPCASNIVKTTKGSL
jgi:hypothetical protein